MCEIVTARPGGAVSLAVGMADIFGRLPGMRSLMAYWYHFAIMFEALFILTTIDAGTRVCRFLVQEFGGRLYTPFARPDSIPSSVIATSIIVLSWAHFIWTGDISTIWPMFGIANQLIASPALAIGTTLINMERVRYAWVTFVPMCFVAVTTLSAGYLSIRGTHTVKRRPRRLSVERIALILNQRSMYDRLHPHELIPRPRRDGENTLVHVIETLLDKGLVLNADNHGVGRRRRAARDSGSAPRCRRDGRSVPVPGGTSVDAVPPSRRSSIRAWCSTWTC